MCSALSKFTSSHNHSELCQPTPKPGEIWQLKHDNRFVIIITNNQPFEIVSVMMLSFETWFLSDVDLLMGTNISGLTQDLLVETWLVLKTQRCNLLRLIGKRISRRMYDVLLDVGDYYHNLVNEPPTKWEIEKLGLRIGDTTTRKQEIKAFHTREEAWSNLLNFNYIQGIKCAEKVLNEALAVEQDLADITVRKEVVLSQWLENIFDINWQVFSPVSQLIIATRSIDNFQPVSATEDEIATLIPQISILEDEYQRRKVIKRLSEIAVGNLDAIQALVNLINATKDDETLWTAVETLWQIDLGHTNIGTRRMKLIDLGMQVAGEAVALAVAIVPKKEEQIGILLQVYPTGNETYLPPGFKMILLDESGQIVWQVKALIADVCLQLKLHGQKGEKFSVRLALEQAVITEDFVI